jgi:hypothetical protein
MLVRFSKIKEVSYAVTTCCIISVARLVYVVYVV